MSIDLRFTAKTDAANRAMKMSTAASDRRWRKNRTGEKARYKPPLRRLLHINGSPATNVGSRNRASDKDTPGRGKSR